MNIKDRVRAHPAVKASARLKQHHLERYGLNINRYESLYAVQGGECAICYQPLVMAFNGTKEPNRAAIDHCHASGQVRGLLCRLCNTGLGSFKDSSANLRRAADYVKRYATDTDIGSDLVAATG